PNRSAGHGRGRLDERHLPTGPIDEAAEFVHAVMEEFDAAFRRPVLAVDQGEESVLFQPVRVLRRALDRHAESFPDRTQTRVTARRDLLQGKDAGARGGVCSYPSTTMMGTPQQTTSRTG